MEEGGNRTRMKKNAFKFAEVHGKGVLYTSVHQDETRSVSNSNHNFITRICL